MPTLGIPGIAVGIGLFLFLWLMLWLSARKHKAFHFDAQGEKGAFEKLFVGYTDLAKLVIGLASGSIVLLVGSSAFHSAAVLPASFASPLYLLGLSILYGVLFMAWMMLDYEDYRHHPGANTYTSIKYGRNQALGFSSLLCFCIGYAWLIIIVTAQPVTTNRYEVVERTESEKPTYPGHPDVHYVLLNDGHKIYATCDLDSTRGLDPDATCRFRPLRIYECVLGDSKEGNGKAPLSDLKCKDAEGHNVYLYVDKKE